MGQSTVRERARRDILRAAHRGLGVPELARTVTTILRRAIPFDGICLLTTDPATLLPTGEITENGLPERTLVRMSEIELTEPDVNKFTALARRPHPAAGLGLTTHGELDRSLRQRELRRPNGFADELRTVLPGPTGTWGALTLLRERRRPLFSAGEVGYLSSLAVALGDGLRRAMLLDDAAPAGTGSAGPGLLLLAGDNTVETANPDAQRWLDALGAGDRAGRLPRVVYAVAHRARQLAADAEPSSAPSLGAAWARVRTPAGPWVVVRGTLLGGGPAARAAVLFEPAGVPELAPLIADAYGLTARERRVTELVAQGCSSAEIAGRLHLSAYTVQDHLKSIFDKSGTGSRGELVARLFVDRRALRLTTPPEPPG